MNILNLSRRIYLGATIALFAGSLAVQAGTPAIAGGQSEVRVVVPMHHATGNGWREVGGVSFAPGVVSEFVHADCPSSNPVAVSGAFAMNLTGQNTNVSLAYNGPRIDESPPDYQEWGWHFYFPSGAPSGTAATFALYCNKS